MNETVQDQPRAVEGELLGKEYRESVNAMEKNAGAVAEFNAVAAGIVELRQRYAGATFDVATVPGMNAAVAARRELRETRIKLEKQRGIVKAPVLALGKSIDTYAGNVEAAIRELEEPIDAQIKAREKELDALREATRKAEEDRLRAIDTRIDYMRQRLVDATKVGITADTIEGYVEELRAYPITPELYDEKLDRAREVHADTIERLSGMIATARANEKAAADLAKARAEHEAKVRADEDARRQEAAREAQRRRDAEEAWEREQAERRRQAEEAETARKAAQKVEDDRLAAERAEQKRKDDEARAEQRRVEEAEAQRRRDELARQEQLAAAERMRLAQEDYERRAQLEQRETEARKEREREERRKAEARRKNREELEAKANPWDALELVLGIAQNGLSRNPTEACEGIILACENTRRARVELELAVEKELA